MLKASFWPCLQHGSLARSLPLPAAQAYACQGHCLQTPIYFLKVSSFSLIFLYVPSFSLYFFIFHSPPFISLYPTFLVTDIQNQGEQGRCMHAVDIIGLFKFATYFLLIFYLMCFYYQTEISDRFLLLNQGGSKLPLIL